MFTKKVIQWLPEHKANVLGQNFDVAAPTTSERVETNVFMDGNFLQTFKSLEEARAYARMTWWANREVKPPLMTLVPINVVVKK
jgi:hypothetical protein